MKGDSREILCYVPWSCDSYLMIVKTEVTPKCSCNRAIMVYAHSSFLKFTNNMAHPGPHWKGGCNILGVINPAVF